MANISFEMDGDDYCLLMQYKKYATLEEWDELKNLKDKAPVIWINQSALFNPFSFSKPRERYYTTNNDVLKILIDENTQLKDKVSKLEVEKISIYSFKNRIKILFFGKV